MANIKKIKLNGVVYNLVAEADLSNVYTKSEVYTKQEVNDAITTAINNITDGDEVAY